MLICGPTLVLLALAAQVEVNAGNDEVAVMIGGRPATTFWYGSGVTKPYLWPLRTASDIELTRRWPMRDQAGDPHDHPHQRGLWFAHSAVNGIDFWNSDPSYHTPNMGRISVAKLAPLRGGAHSGSVEAELFWKSPEGTELVRERRRMRFNDGTPRTIDFDIELLAAARIVFGDDKDGVFGMRLARELEEPSATDPLRTGVMIGSNGCRQEAACWGTQADWLDVTGQFGSAAAGVTVFDHPSNPRHPTYWHARGYGLLAANIFGVKAFTRDSHADGSLVLDAGKALRFRYRVVLHDGVLAPKDLAKLYRAWASNAALD